MLVEIVLLPLTGELTEVARARAWARDNCAGAGADQLADIMAVVDELTSNALRHAVPPYALRLLRSPGYLRVEVDDGSPELVRARAPSTTGGRGLHLVEALTRDWGQVGHAGGKTVWAEPIVDTVAR